MEQNLDTYFKYIKEAYLRLLQRRYKVAQLGQPVPCGNKEIWGSEGLFEELNKILPRPITWKEFKTILRLLQEKLGDGIRVTWFIPPCDASKEPEPHEIRIYRLVI